MSSKRKRKRQRTQQEAQPVRRLLVCRTLKNGYYLDLDSTGGPLMVADWREAHVWGSVEEACAYMDRMTGLKLVTLVVQ